MKGIDEELEDKINLWVSVLAVRGKHYNGVKLSEDECIEISSIIKKLKELVGELEDELNNMDLEMREVKTFICDECGAKVTKVYESIYDNSKKICESCFEAECNNEEEDHRYEDNGINDEPDVMGCSQCGY